MHSLDVRYRAVVHYTHFLRSLRRVSRLYGVSKSSLQRWINTAPASTAQRHRRGRGGRHLRDDVARLVATCVKDNPFVTTTALAARVAQECGLRRSPRTLSRYLRRVGYSRKRAYDVVNKGEPQAERVAAFCAGYPGLEDQDRLVCIDEAGFYVGDHHRFGYAPRGRRLNVSCGARVRRSKYTLLMAITSRGVLHHQVLDHNCRKADFVDFIDSLPVPPGHRLLMDNVAFHHSRETRDAIAAKGCQPLYIPPYSPRCNAIENVFGVLKRAYRTRCPAVVEAGFDYRGTMEALLQEWRARDLAPFFARVRRWVDRAVAGEPAPGYDET